MKRREFLGAGLGSFVAAAACPSALRRAAHAEAAPGAPAAGADPRDVTLNVKPVMTNILHSGVWEGPCRWRGISVADEKARAEQSFARWSKDLPKSPLGRVPGVRLLEPAHVTFAEDFVLKPEDLKRVAADAGQTDVLLVYPAGSSISAFELGDRFQKPILLQGLNCRCVDIVAYARAKGNEAYGAADGVELAELASLLRARKVFRRTRVLFPTDRGLPAVCSVGSIWELADLEKRLGVAVKLIPYRELADEMDRLLADPAANTRAEQAAESLLARADRSFIEKPYVARSMLFHEAVGSLMTRHACNGLTIECFEFCSSKLPDRWKITPCLIHALLRNSEMASSCEGDLGSLLAIRMLMSVSGRSCHQGNSDPREAGTFRINHSSSSMKMAGFDQPDTPYQLGRFVTGGWGTKVVLDFLKLEDERRVTVARVDPTATRLLVLKGELVGASGWDEDLIGCSVEALIRPPEGRADEFIRKRLQYGNHMQWVYGDHTEKLCRLGEMLGLEVELIA